MLLPCQGHGFRAQRRFGKYFAKRPKLVSGAPKRLWRGVRRAPDTNWPGRSPTVAPKALGAAIFGCGWLPGPDSNQRPTG